MLVHLDDTCHENGEIRFLAGSHKQGALQHITGTEEEPSAPHLPTGEYRSAPHLPTGEYRLADSVPVPARRGDMVVFSYYTIHGSYINGTDRSRRMVRVGYRHPHNPPSDGAVRKPGLLVSGYRERRGDEALLF